MPESRTRTSAVSRASSSPGATACATSSVSEPAKKTKAPTFASFAVAVMSNACSPRSVAMRLPIAGTSWSPGGSAYATEVATARRLPRVITAYSTV